MKTAAITSNIAHCIIKVFHTTSIHIGKPLNTEKHHGRTMNTQKIFFHVGNQRLNGTLHRPAAIADKPASIPVVIGSHGLLSNGESPKQKTLAEKLNQHGIAYFRFDHRGRGESDGTFSGDTSFQGRVNDMHAAITTVLSCPGIGTSIGLFGSSMGGAVCLGIADQFDIKTIVILAAPVRLESIQIPHDIMEDPLFRNMKPEQMNFDISDRLEKIGNILIFHGDADTVVSFSNALEIYEKVARPKKLIRFKGADHAVSRLDFQEQFINESVEWFVSHLK